MLTQTVVHYSRWPSPVPPYPLRVRAYARGYRPRAEPTLQAAALWSPDDEQWIAREQDKQARAPLPPLPAGIADRFPEHCAHRSQTDPTMIAYTPDYLYGRQDRQVRLKPGRYLAKYYPEIPAPVVSGWVQAFAPASLTISSDADVIADVYYYGPPSCQHPESSHANEYTRSLAQHPTRMYAGPDLAIAFLGPRDGAIARAIVWPDEKIYCRVYGDPSLADRLQAEGYAEGSLEGARCRAIWDGDRLIVPYVDGVRWGEVRGQYVILSDAGDVDLQTTRGYWEEAPLCDYCGEERGGYDDTPWCQRCYDVRWTCDDCGAGSFDDDTGFCTGQGRYCEDCYQTHTRTCTQCEDEYDPTAWVRSDRQQDHRRHGIADYDEICPGCADRHQQCARAQCDKYTLRRNGPHCEECRVVCTGRSRAGIGRSWADALQIALNR